MSLRIFTVISTSHNTTLNRTTIYHIFSFWLPKHICPLWHFHNTEAHRQNHKFGLQNAHKTLKHATNAMFSIKHHNLWSKRKSMGENAPRKKKIYIYIYFTFSPIVLDDYTTGPHQHHIECFPLQCTDENSSLRPFSIIQASMRDMCS